MRWCSLVVMMFASVVVAKDDLHEIVIRRSKSGDIAEVVKEDTSTQKSIVFKDGKEFQKKAVTSVEKSSYLEEILAKEEKRAVSKLSRIYRKADVKVDGSDLKLDLDDKTVIIERKKEGYTYTHKGEVLQGDAFKLLDNEFRSKKDNGDEILEKFILPGKKVALGETWDIKVDAFAKEFTDGKDEGTFDLKKSKATGKLNRVYTQDGKKFGVVTIDIELVLQKLFNSPAKAEDGSKMNLKMVLDVCIDGTADTGKVELSMEMDAKAKLDNGIEVDFSIKSKKIETRAAPKKKE